MLPRSSTCRLLPVALAFTALVLLAGAPAAGESPADFEGFTEPFRTVDVACAETGTVLELHVEEGQRINQGQRIADLDRDVLEALLAVAKQNKNARGQLDSARAELELKAQRLAQLTELRSAGHARQEEVDRARADVEIARSKLLSVEEELLVRRLEYEKVLTQIKRRSVYAPLSGHVKEVHKQVGEFVAPNTPHIATIVQLDPLLATFSLPADAAMPLRVDDPVAVHLRGQAQPVTGRVHFVSPVTDAESGTIRVRVLLENPELRIRSGERCSLQLVDPTKS